MDYVYNKVKCRAIERMVPQLNKMVVEEMKSKSWFFFLKRSKRLCSFSWRKKKEPKEHPPHQVWLRLLLSRLGIVKASFALLSLLHQFTLYGEDVIDYGQRPPSIKVLVWFTKLSSFGWIMIVYYAGTDEGSLDKTTERNGGIRGRFSDPLYFLLKRRWMTPYGTPVSRESWRKPAPRSRQASMISLRDSLSKACTFNGFAISNWYKTWLSWHDLSLVRTVYYYWNVKGAIFPCLGGWPEIF